MLSHNCKHLTSDKYPQVSINNNNISHEIKTGMKSRLALITNASQVYISTKDCQSNIPSVEIRLFFNELLPTNTNHRILGYDIFTILSLCHIHTHDYQSPFPPSTFCVVFVLDILISIRFSPPIIYMNMYMNKYNMPCLSLI